MKRLQQAFRPLHPPSIAYRMQKAPGRGNDQISTLNKRAMSDLYRQVTCTKYGMRTGREL